MRVSPVKKMVVGVATAVGMVVSLLAAPASAEPVIEGTIIVKTVLGDIVFEVPGDPEGVCAGEAGVEFTATPSGDQDEGTIDVEIEGKGFIKKPGDPNGGWDSFNFYTLPEAQFVEYERVDAAPPWTYELTGFVVVFADVWNVKDVKADPENCDKGSYKCTLAVLLDLQAGTTHTNPSIPLPTIESGSVTILVADAAVSGGVQFIGGDCGVYIALVGSDVQVDLTVTHP